MLSQDKAVLASLALPKNRLAGAIFAGHHLWWKGSDTAAETKKVENPSNEKEKKMFLQYAASNSLLGLSKGLNAEIAWNSGKDLTADQAYFGLKKIGSSSVEAEAYYADIFYETVPRIDKAAGDSLKMSKHLILEYSTLETEMIMLRQTLPGVKVATAKAFDLYETEKPNEVELDAALVAMKVAGATLDLSTTALNESWLKPSWGQREAEYKASLETYETETKELRGTLKKFRMRQGSAIRKLEETIRKLEEKLATSEARLLQMKKKNQALAKDFTTHINTTRDKMAAIKEKNKKDMEKVDAATEENTDRLETLLKACEERMKKYKSKQEEAKNAANEAANENEQLKIQLDENKTTFQQMEKQKDLEKDVVDREFEALKIELEASKKAQQEIIIQNSETETKLKELKKRSQEKRDDDIKTQQAKAEETLKKDEEAIAQAEAATALQIKEEEEVIAQEAAAAALQTKEKEEIAKQLAQKVRDANIIDTKFEAVRSVPEKIGDAVEMIFHINQAEKDVAAPAIITTTDGKLFMVEDIKSGTGKFGSVLENPIVFGSFTKKDLDAGGFLNAYEKRTANATPSFELQADALTMIVPAVAFKTGLKSWAKTSYDMVGFSLYVAAQIGEERTFFQISSQIDLSNMEEPGSKQALALVPKFRPNGTDNTKPFKIEVKLDKGANLSVSFNIYNTRGKLTSTIETKTTHLAGIRPAFKDIINRMDKWTGVSVKLTRVYVYGKKSVRQGKKDTARTAFYENTQVEIPKSKKGPLSWDALMTAKINALKKMDNVLSITEDVATDVEMPAFVSLSVSAKMTSSWKQKKTIVTNVKWW